MDKIAIVVQRYGKEINGGAEVHARMLAERLKARYEVEVLTSCCADYHTWENHYPEGEEIVDDVRVLRFASENYDRKAAYRLFRYLRGNRKYCHARPAPGNMLILPFRRFKYRKRKNHDQLFERWMEGNGPVCREMISYMEQERDRYKAFVIFTYLFHPTYAGLQKVSDKSILIPLAHDEHPFYFSGFGKMFSLPRFLMYNTRSEKQLVESVYPVTRTIRSDIAGVGFDRPPLGGRDELPPVASPYLVYIGRIDAEKGCLELMDYFSRTNNKFLRNRAKLVMIGKNSLRTAVKSHRNVIFTGFIGEEEKQAYLRHCRALVIPSRYESLSLVTLEAMSAGKPVLANGHCDVLKTHIEQSGAGFVYYNEKDFVMQTGRILGMTEHERQVIARKGLSYVEKNYQWPSIMRKFDAAINYVCSHADRAQ